VVVRELQTKADFGKYFSLRYNVWKEMNYLPPSQDCANSQWELNFTDRTSFPVGAFDGAGSLIGCARLVYPLGQRSSHISVIESCIADRNDLSLAKVFESPRSLTHPFDLLESLEGFDEYFKGLVRRRLRYAEVSRVIVHPAHRSTGLGEVLVDSLVSLAIERQVNVLFLACNEGLQGFYEHCGFQVLPGLHCDRFAGVNAPAIAMFMELQC
jgi:GNAT superfamily N-acetyltransferase